MLRRGLITQTWLLLFWMSTRFVFRTAHSLVSLEMISKCWPGAANKGKKDVKKRLKSDLHINQRNEWKTRHRRKTCGERTWYIIMRIIITMHYFGPKIPCRGTNLQLYSWRAPGSLIIIVTYTVAQTAKTTKTMKKTNKTPKILSMSHRLLETDWKYCKSDWCAPSTFKAVSLTLASIRVIISSWCCTIRANSLKIVPNSTIVDSTDCMALALSSRYWKLLSSYINSCCCCCCWLFCCRFVVAGES